MSPTSSQLSAFFLHAPRAHGLCNQHWTVRGVWGAYICDVNARSAFFSQTPESKHLLHQFFKMLPGLIVTVGPKGRYREADIIESVDARSRLEDTCLRRELLLALRLHPSRASRWHHSKGQPPDTDLNEFVRAAFSHKESAMLLDKMHGGLVVPS